MPIGKNFYGYNYGPTLTSQLMEEKPQDIAINDCRVWKFDVDHYNQTGKVRKLEYLREEKPPKTQKAHPNANGHFVWDKEGKA